MNKNTVLRELAQKKYNVIESHIVRVDDTLPLLLMMAKSIQNKILLLRKLLILRLSYWQKLLKHKQKQKPLKQ
jgi:hypothetical protein